MNTGAKTEGQNPNELFEAGRYAEALEQYRLLAEDGSVESQIFVGWMYKQGHGTTKDTGEARKWYERAAAADSAAGHHRLGSLHLEEGRSTDALRCFEAAAKLGYSPSMYRLGRMHEHGIGVPADREKAYGYYEQAARQGNLWADRRIIGRMMRGDFGLAQIPGGVFRLARMLCLFVKIFCEDEYDERVQY